MTEDDVNSQEDVKKQYEVTDNLDIRIALHEKYSSNKQGFGSWIFSHYQFKTASANTVRVLDVGCGTADLWAENYANLPVNVDLILTDYSKGMVAASTLKMEQYQNVQCERADIMDLPFDANSFDVVTANMMLYHVPDLEGALKEVHRVLKSDGVFYTSTFGTPSLAQTLGSWLSHFTGVVDSPETFTLQNGATSLKTCFTDVVRLDYPDSLEVTDARDLLAYVYSLPEVFHLKDTQRQDVLSVLASHKVDGVISIPKEYGLFVCRP